MGKSLFIAEKPSVAQEFAKALGETMTRHEGYQESKNLIVTWCVGHLITMSLPDAYDEKYKKWSLSTLPFIPDHFRYEVIPSSAKQFGLIRKLLNRRDVEHIYVCTDSGREGEYIYRLVRQEAGVSGKDERRVWIDSQTRDEILRGIREAKSLRTYDRLSDSAYLRAKEDYLMGINFSRALTLRYGNAMAKFLGKRYCVVSVGRVMTCVLGMIVFREREIRQFETTVFYRIFANAVIDGNSFFAEWRATERTKYFNSPLLYKENMFRRKKDAEEMIASLQEGASSPFPATVLSVDRRKERKNPPLLYNLAELQNDCSKMFKISPDQTLDIAQELYEKKLTTYPRTDARVLSSAIAKVIGGNIAGLENFSPSSAFAQKILEKNSFRSIGKTRYVDDSRITDHYAIIPTGQTSEIRNLSNTSYGVYCQIVKRFLSIFFPPCIYQKTNLTITWRGENFFSSFRVLEDEGYLAVMKSEEKIRGNETYGNAFPQPDIKSGKIKETFYRTSTLSKEPDANSDITDTSFVLSLEKLRKGMKINIMSFAMRKGRSSPPKRYSSGSIILAMENAGQLIEDAELREQIKSSGIGTSATRAQILKKLEKDGYIALNKKTQVLSPTLLGEMICDTVKCSIRALLNPALTASWEKGLDLVVEGTVSSEEYMVKLASYITRWTNFVKATNNQDLVFTMYQSSSRYYGRRTDSIERGSADKAKRVTSTGKRGKIRTT